MYSNKRIIIIGGGLNGLVLAYLLSKEHIHATILEASPRLGGRIQTFIKLILVIHQTHEIY